MQFTIPSLQVHVDPPADGPWNMAVDEALLIAAAVNGRATLRFYQWSEPTLSIGYFQSYADRQRHPASLACPLVRRASGGGAIVHDAELTYSLAVPHPRTPAACLYGWMHETLIAALTEFEVAATRWGDCPAGKPSPSGMILEPFLCFQRRAPGDVVADGFKIGGSAQRRRGQAVLQHGSVLLRSSSAAPELPGISELASRVITPGDLIKAWMSRISARGLLLSLPTHLEGQICQTAAQLLKEKYTSTAWNQRR